MVSDVEERGAGKRSLLPDEPVQSSPNKKIKVCVVVVVYLSNITIGICSSGELKVEQGERRKFFDG